MKISKKILFQMNNTLTQKIQFLRNPATGMAPIALESTLGNMIDD